MGVTWQATPKWMAMTWQAKPIMDGRDVSSNTYIYMAYGRDGAGILWMAMACQAIPIWMGMTWHAIHTNMDGCEVSSKTYMDGRDVATDIYIYICGWP